MRRFFIALLACIALPLLQAAPISLGGSWGQLTISRENIELTGSLTKNGENQLLWQYQTLQCQITMEDGGTTAKIVRFAFRCDNPGDLYKLHVKLENTLPATTPISFFNGAKTVILSDKVQQRTNPFDVFPLVSIFDAKQGVAIGLTPDSVVGQFSSRAVCSGKRADVSFTAQVVVDNKKVQDLGLISMLYTPEFGWANAVEEYYNLFPKSFTVANDINPAIFGVGGYYIAANQQHPLELHGARRSKMNWEWTYAPWLEAGNWYAEPEQWQQGINEIPNFYKYREHKKGTFQEFRDAVTRQFDSGSRNAAMYFYILVKDMMTSLGDQYPDAKFTDENDKPLPLSGLWSIPANQDKTYFTFAPGTGLQQHVETMLKKCVDNYRIDGFAFDMANFSMRNYSKAQLNYATGRAFDENGKIYTPDSILPVYFADYLHTLKRDGQRMSIYMNMALEHQSAIGVFHTDGLMFEGNPEGELDHVIVSRLMSGRKPMTFWNGIAMSEMTHNINWGVIPPEGKAKVHRELATLLLLQSLRYGASPMNWSICYDGGNFFIPYLNSILSMKKAGWNPVSAIRSQAGDRLWYGRFGYQDATILTISNPQRETIETEVEVLQSYFKGGQYLLLPHDGRRLEQSVDRDVIRFKLKLAPKQAVIFAVAPVKMAQPIHAALSGSSWHDLELTSAAPLEISLPVTLPDGTVLKDSRFTKDFLPLAAGETVKIHYLRPEIVGTDEATVTRFFTARDQADPAKAPVLLLPKNPSRELESIAIMVDRYYPYCAGSLAYAKRNWTQEVGFIDAKYATENPLKIVHARPNSGKAIAIGTVADFPELALDLPADLLENARFRKSGWIVPVNPDTLWLGGLTDAEVKKASDLYFEILDKQ